MREEVVLEVVDERDGLIQQLIVAATLHQDGFGAEHLRHFGEDGGATLLLAEEVGESTKEWIGCDAREAIRTTALEANAQFAGWYGLTLVLLSLLDEFGEEIDTIGNLIALNFLADHELHTVLVVVAAELLEDARLVVLATKTYNENGTCIGMMYHVAQDLLGVLVVLAQLRAAKVMGEVEDAVDAFNLVTTKGCTSLFDDLLDDAVDTTYGRDDPDFVADAYLAIRTHIALEGELFTRWLIFLQSLDVDVAVVKRAGKVGLDILVIEIGTLLDGVTSMADGEAVLDDVLAFGKVLECALVTCGNVGNKGNLLTVNIDNCTFLQRLECYENVVGRIDFQELFHF